MDKAKLNRYFWLNHEVEKQEKRRARLQKNAEEIATDVVSGSICQFPYIETKIKITGMASGALEKLEASIEKNIDEAMNIRAEIEEFINSIEEPQMRELLRSRFIDCLGWKEVGKDNFITPDHARKKVRLILKNIS